GLPTFIVSFLRDRENTLTHHWSAPALPAVWLATVSGLELVRARWRGAALALVALSAGFAYAIMSPLPGGFIFDPNEFVRGPRELALERAVALVPTSAPAAVSQNVAPHLANRSELFVYPIDDT